MAKALLKGLSCAEGSTWTAGKLQRQPLRKPTLPAARSARSSVSPCCHVVAR